MNITEFAENSAKFIGKGISIHYKTGEIYAGTLVHMTYRGVDNRIDADPTVRFEKVELTLAGQPSTIKILETIHGENRVTFKTA